MKPDVEPVDFYHPNLPAYSRQSTRYDTQEIVSILLDPHMKDDRVCKTQVTCVEHNATFVVDLSCLATPKDMYVDDMGSWKYNGVYRAWVTVDSNGFVSSHGTCKPTVRDSASLFYICKKYFVHKTSSDLKKTVALLSGKCCL